MSNEKQETIADIVKELRGIKGGQHTNGGLSFERWRARCQFADDYADRIEAAHQREVAELKRQRKEALAIASDIDKCASIERHTEAMLKKNEVIVCLRKEVAELRGCLRMAVVNARIARTCCASGRECDNCGQSCDARKWNKVIVATKGASND